MNRSTLMVVACVVAVLGAAGWYMLRSEPSAPEVVLAPPAETAGGLTQEQAEARIEYPLPEAAETEASEPLPALDESDARMREALDGVFGTAPLESFLIPERIVRRIVVSVISLDGEPVPLRLRPLRHTPGLLMVKETADGRILLDPKNGERYRPLVAALQVADMEAVAALYVRYYPLFQKAYEELGYPDRYFNDRLIRVLSHLLETREITGPIELVRPKVLYEFADRELEKRSSGEKILIRIGPQNAEVVRSKLRELRVALIAKTAQR